VGLGVKVGVGVRVGVMVGVAVTVVAGVISSVGLMVISGVGVGVVSNGMFLNFRPKKKAKPSKPTIISRMRKDKIDCRPLLAGINGVSSSAIKVYYKLVFFFVKLDSVLTFLACKFPGFTL